MNELRASQNNMKKIPSRANFVAQGIGRGTKKLIGSSSRYHADRALDRVSLRQNAKLADRLNRIEETIADLRAMAADMAAVQQFVVTLGGQTEALLEKLARADDISAATATEEAPSLDLVDPAYRAGLLRNISVPGSKDGRFSKHLIIPVHLPKVVHLSSIFAKVEDAEPDKGEILLTLVATTPEERLFIERYVALAKPAMPTNFEIVSAVEICRVLKWDDLEAAIIENRAGGVINMKKLLALYRATSRGAQQVCCADIDIMMFENLEKIFKISGDNYRKKMFFSAFSSIEITKEVSKACKEYFRSNERQKLDCIYEGELFSWFFDIPTFFVDDVEQFFAHIQSIHGGLESALSRLSWHHFDYILYINFLLLKKGFSLIDVRSIVRPGSITDSFNLTEVKAIEERYDYKPVWATLSALAKVDTAYVDAGFPIICHIDRG